MTDPLCDLLQMLCNGVTHGEEPAEIVARYLEALAQSGRIVGGSDDVALEMLARALRGDKALAMKLSVGRAKAGKPVAKEVRAKVGHRAANMVERLLAEGWKQEAALAEAERETRLSRSEIMTWLKNRRDWRDYAAARPIRAAAARAREMFIGGATLANALESAAHISGLEQAEIVRWLEPEERLLELRAEWEARAATISG
jgi:hypothetical protein